MNIGDTLKIDYKVIGTDSATKIAITEDDSFPNVLATARMIALMEVTSARLMKPILATGEHSVGVGVNVTHLSATSIGAKVNIVSEFVRQEGKLYTFNVYLYDSNGLVGKGEHSRAVVNTERLEGKASRSTSQKI
ncbi:thioesterase family protein [Vibrio alginolyticus]